MTIKGVFILPHGSLVLDPTIENVGESAENLHNKMKKVAKIIEALSPDICLLTTPHGIGHSNEFCFYNNHLARGTAEWEEKYSSFSVKVDINNTFTKAFVDFLQRKNNMVGTITAFAQGVPTPLRWGEVVPLWFLKNLPCSYQIMSIPTRRYTQAKEMIPELQKIGKDIQEFCSNVNQDVVIITSADLAHTHMETSHFGFHENGKIFDNLIQKWVIDQRTSILTEEALPLLDTALCCGYTGIVILDEILKKHAFKPKIHAYEHPTYYGMLIASFI